MAEKKYLTEKLTDIAIRQATPKDKDYWLDDGGALRLLVKKNGTKCWRFNYRYQGKQKTLAIGVYPTIKLKAARQALADAKALIKQGIDPSQQKKERKKQLVKPNHLFGVVVKEWWQHQKGTWTKDHANRVLTRLQDNTLMISKMDINTLTTSDVIKVVKKIEQRGARDVAQRVLQDIRRVCRYALQQEILTNNPFNEITSDILKARKTTHRPSLPREELPQFLRDLDNYHLRGRLLTELSIKLLIYTFVRSTELRGARWEEFDLHEGLWRIPGKRMKMGTDHIVPLATQAVEVLRQIQRISQQYALVFPSENRRTNCMSDNTMRRAIIKMGYDGNTTGKSKCVPHGFRATASSILNESGFNPDAIERQLAHIERNGVRAAYTHHARYLDERKAMMQWWGDYLGELKNTEKVVPIFAKAK